MSNDTFSPEDLFNQFATGGFNQEPPAQAAASAPTFQSQGAATGAGDGGQGAATGEGQQQGQTQGQQPNSELAELKAMIEKQNETITALRAQSLGGAPTFQDQHQQGFGQQQQRPQGQPATPPPDPQATKEAWLARFYEDPLSAVDQIAQARANQMLAQHVEPLRAESTNTSVENFLSEQRVSDGIYEAVEPQFRKMLNDRNVQQTLARMPHAQRRNALNDIYNAATGVAYRSNLQSAMKNGKIDFRPAPSYSAGYTARSNQSSSQSSNGYDEATQMAYDRLVASGVPASEAADMLKDGE